MTGEGHAGPNAPHSAAVCIVVVQGSVLGPMLSAVTYMYLGFHKGVIFSLATNAFTKGSQTIFPIYSWFFLAKGLWLNGPLKYATDYMSSTQPILKKWWNSKAIR